MDNVTVFPPGATSAAGPYIPSQIGIGTWIRADPGVDYGARGLIQSIKTQNALRRGAVFSHNFAGQRNMAFPLLIRGPYGVNRLGNPGFETATYGPAWAQGLTLATVTVVGNASVAPGAGSYYALSTVGASVAGAANPNTLLLQNLGVIPTGEPFFLAARMCEFTPSNANNYAGAYLFLQNALGFRTAPDTQAAGYVFGYNNVATPNQPVGFTNGMKLPPGTWTSVGGIISAQAMASLIASTNCLPIYVYQYMYTPSFGNTAGASYSSLAADEIEFRSAFPQRSMREWEAQLRNYTAPGAYISVQPEGVPTQEAVFFDVLDGRWEPDYDLYENRAAARKGTLFLETQPFGYWATEILLASSASVGFMGNIAVNGASVIGDVPPPAHVIIAPTVASGYAAGTWLTDMVAYSLGGAASFRPFLPAASFTLYPGASLAGSVAGDKYAPASQALVITATGQVGWQRAAILTGIPAALEPAYRGRFRAFGFVRTTPSGPAWSVAVDANANFTALAFASANQQATAYSVIPSANAVGSFVSPSPAYSLLDLGEITLPPVASGGYQGEGVGLRLWVNPNAGLNAGAQLLFGGAYLLPVDGPAGILTRGLYVPSINDVTIIGGQAGQLSQVQWNMNFVDSVSITSGGSAVYADGRAQYRGVTPRLGASTAQLTILTGDRSVGTAAAATYPVADANVEYAQVSVSYRPTFQFLYGL